MSGRPIGTRASEPPNPGEEHLALEGAPVDRLRFRPDRHAAEELEHVQLLLDMLMGADRVHAPVLDFSERGLGIAAPSGVELVAGQRIDEVRVQAGRYELYRGPARVVEQSGRPDRRGLALLGTHLDVDLLFGIDRRAGQLGVIEDALRPVLGALAGAEVPASFRAVVADLATVLGALHAELGAAKLEPPDLDDLEALVAPSFLHLVAELDRTAVGALGPMSAYAKRLLHAPLLEAPIAARAWSKPRGYAGDFELMDLIYRRRDEADDAFGRLLNRLICRLRPSRAAVARVSLLAGFLRDEIARRADAHPRLDGRPIRIASMASGPAEEVVALLGAPLPGPIDVSLLDQDWDALNFCSRRLLFAEDRKGVAVRYFQAAVKTLIADPESVLERVGTFDVVYSVGLFDYLPDNAARATLKSLRRFVAPGGVLLVGNYDRHEGRGFMEQLLDWHLVYRSEADLRRLARSCFEGWSAMDVLSEASETQRFLRLRFEAEA